MPATMHPSGVMRVCIVGAGALGCTIGAALARGSVQGGGEPIEVWLVNRNRDHVDAITRRGLLVRLGDGPAATEHTVRLRAATSTRGIGPVDVVIVLVKSFATADAARQAEALLGPETVVLTLQNGLGNEQALASVLGAQRVLQGITYVGGRLIGPGQVSSGVAGKRTVIGELDGRVTPSVRRIADAFGAAGLATEVADDITGAVWDKLLVNVSTGALSALTRLTYGDLMADPGLERTACAAVQEGIDIATALGVSLSVHEPQAIWRSAAQGLPTDFKTSMLQSIESGRRTEIDVINGALVRDGERTGVPTPVNSTLVAAVRGLETGLGHAQPTARHKPA